MKTINVRRLLLGLLAALALTLAGALVPAVPGTATTAQAQISAEFQEALAPYGHWERNARWGEVWVPDDTPPDWRPYQYGHWVYTEEWGWYWISDPEEEDWGWVAYHYGRWIHDRGAWFWIPGDEWAPAWVDWRYGEDSVGWAPLPPDELIAQYDDDPAYWVFVAARFLAAPRLHSYYVPRDRHGLIFRRSHVINRTLRYGRDRAAVNPGVSPAFVARRTGRALPTYRVSPHVLAGTRGVAGALRVSPQQLRGPAGPRGRRPSTTHVHAATVQRASTTIKPAATTAAPAPLGNNQRGQLGRHPPRAAQGAPTVQPLPRQQPPKQLQRTPPPAGVKPTPPPQQPRVLHPPPARSAVPPTPPQVERTQPAVRPPPPTVKRPPPPTVRHAPPPTVRQAPPPTVKRAAPQRPPQATRPPPQRPPQARKPPPQAGKPAARKPPPKPGQKPAEQTK